MGIIDILKGIERLAVELLLWFIYIPKTIYKIIKDPNWVPVYVNEELAKEEKFKGYMSPVLLFLGISVILFVLLDSGIITSASYDNKSAGFSDRIQDAVGLLFLTIPLFFALFTEIFRNGGLQKQALMQGLYVQCFYLSPVMLSLFAYLIADQFDWQSSGTYINLAETPSYLFSITLLWFVIVQVKYIAAELRYKKIIALGIVFLWVIILGAGVSTYNLLFTPVTVDKVGTGDNEILTMTLPKDDEYQINVYHYYAPNDTVNTSEDYVGDENYYDYKISIDHTNSKSNNDSIGSKLIHNQYVFDTVKSQLRFWFQGNKGDDIDIELENLTLSPAGEISLYTKKPRENLLLNAEGGPKDGVYIDIDEELNMITLGIYDLPESGIYHLILTELSNLDEEYWIGMYRSDHYGAAQSDVFGKLTYGTTYDAEVFSYDGLYQGYDIWKFNGKMGEEIEILASPYPNYDMSFDVFDSEGESVVPIDRTLVANIIHWVYVIFFGYIIIIGFRAFFRSSKSELVINENNGNRLGRLLAIAALVMSAVIIFLYLVLPIIFSLFPQYRN